MSVATPNGRRRERSWSVKTQLQRLWYVTFSDCQDLALMSDTHKSSAQNKLNPNHSISETVTLENKLHVESLKDINGKQTKGLPVTTEHRTPDPSLATRLHRPQGLSTIAQSVKNKRNGYWVHYILFISTSTSTLINIYRK